MLTRTEAERLANAVHALRPDWPIASLLSFLRWRQERPMRDMAIQLVWVALDPDTKTPARIDQDGPWKIATAASSRPQVLAFHPELTCTTCFKRKGDCLRIDAITPPEHRHEFTSAVDDARKETA